MKPLTATLCLLVILHLYSCGDAEITASHDTKSSTDTVALADAPPEEIAQSKKHAFYNSITALIDSAGDYALDNGTFKIISNNPLHIQISNIAMATQSDDELKKLAMHGIVYVAYDAFASTNIKEIAITSVPIVYDGEKSKKIGFAESARYTATIKKERARQVMQRRIGTSNFDDLLGNGEFSNSPSPAFDKLKSEDSIEEVLTQLMEK